MTPQFNRFAREELAPGIDFVPTYGNTLMGLACPKPFDPADDYAITYYPPLPRAVFEMVDPDDPERAVGYGETGRVMLTTITRDFFMPRFLERDEGERAEPCAAARREPLIQRGGQHRRRRAFFDRGAHRPAAFAGIRHAPGKTREVRLLGKSARGEIEQP